MIIMEHMISGSSQPDCEDDHIMLDTPAEDAFETSSKNAGDSVIPEVLTNLF